MRARLNPLLFFNGKSAAKPRTEERSTTIPKGSTSQAIGDGNSGRPKQYQDEDIVCTHMRV